MIRKRKKKTDPIAMKVVGAQILLYINALAWFCFSIYIGIDMYLSKNEFPAIFLVSVFLLINGGVMVFCGIMIGRRLKWVFFFTLLVLFANAMFTRAGQFHNFDLPAFLFDIFIFVFIVSFGGQYLKSL